VDGVPPLRVLPLVTVFSSPAPPRAKSECRQEALSRWGRRCRASSFPTAGVGAHTWRPERSRSQRRRVAVARPLQQAVDMGAGARLPAAGRHKRLARKRLAAVASSRLPRSPQWWHRRWPWRGAAEAGSGVAAGGVCGHGSGERCSHPYLRRRARTGGSERRGVGVGVAPLPRHRGAAGSVRRRRASAAVVPAAAMVVAVAPRPSAAPRRRVAALPRPQRAAATARLPRGTVRARRFVGVGAGGGRVVRPPPRRWTAAAARLGSVCAPGRQPVGGVFGAGARTVGGSPLRRLLAGGGRWKAGGGRPRRP